MNGNQADGFEELCTQFARAEAPTGSKFVRTGNPDGGVECYAELDGGDEWGWQAKYFLRAPDASQWSQIDKSVRTALRSRPRLARYIVCAPVDLPAGRTGRRKSAIERWNERVQKWQGWATNRGMSVEFVWWGSSELIARLNKPEQAGAVRYWFDRAVLDDEWFTSRLGYATASAGARYTRLIHVSTPVPASRNLETFARSEAAVNCLKSLSVGIRQTFRYVSQPDQERLISEHQMPFDDLAVAIRNTLKRLSDLRYEPAGEYPLAEIVKDLDTAIDAANSIDSRLESLAFDNAGRGATQYPPKNEYDNILAGFRYTLPELRKAKRQVEHTIEFANAKLMVLTGKAGVGKTHLLCDFAERCLESGTPVVLLMGQMFTATDDPGRQIILQLDYPNDDTFEEFVGALESAARVKNRRALIIIDALNEGQGKEIWNPHLATLIRRIDRSDWIGTILSVREEYLEEIVPTEVRERVPITTHQGFDGIESNAVRIFFEHYGVELPSTPVLHPEFSNPLWLKLICEGLRDANEKRMPRGINGITKPLERFTSAVNSRLAKPSALDYDSNDDLVRRAVIALAERMAADDTTWLDREDAKQIVDQFLPNRTFSKSLYHALVVEGVLTESQISNDTDGIVYFAYERLADHLKVNFLLQDIDANSPEPAFASDGPLAFLHGDRYVPRGIIDALYIQTPERTGRELVELVPSLRERFDVEAFAQSIIWRDPDAVTAVTKRITSQLVQQQTHWNNIVDSLLTIAVVPDHPLNADYLHQLLSSCAMPERDAWWSVHLHWSWSYGGPINRLVEWALSPHARTFPDEVVELASISLAWALTASNRYLRDRATKALVNLLDRRLTATERLADKFASVDDPYVRERVYAVAYGVAMRSNDAAAVSRLAQSVYRHVFEQGAPSAHILLRDYARGVIERAIHLGENPDVKLELVRPPYGSVWPDVPDEETIQKLLAAMDNSQDAAAPSTPGWGKIELSVLHWDFAHYIIGTNFANQSHDWLSRTLEEEPWQSSDRRRETLLSQLNEEERLALEEYDAARHAMLITLDFLFDRGGSEPQDDAPDPAQLRVDAARAQLADTMSDDHFAQWESLDAEEPRFDLRTIQRYILNRVVEMGWNAERFSDFDETLDRMRNTGRRANKAERIGKKYQWIAYHEILAYIADRYQFCPSWDGTQEYQGPWQLTHGRDIDPSVIPRPRHNGRETPPTDLPTWWAPLEYDNWQPSSDVGAWITDQSDVLSLHQGLIVEPSNTSGELWLTAHGYQSRKQSVPADVYEYDAVRREIWRRTEVYLIPKGKADDFIEWVLSGEYWTNDWVAAGGQLYNVFLGEHAWSPCSLYEDAEPQEVAKEWHYPSCSSSPNTASPLATTYSTGFGEYDCSVSEDEVVQLHVPRRWIVEDFPLRWTGKGADYVDSGGAVVVFDPSVHEPGPSAMLVNAEAMENFLDAHDLELCWTVIGEKQTLGTSGQPYGWLKMFGAYVYRDGVPVGEQRCSYNAPSPPRSE